MLHQTETLVGRAGAQQFAAAKRRGVASAKLTTPELKNFGDAAWERGTAVATRADSKRNWASTS